MPFSEIKIDRSLVSCLAGSGDSRTILKSVLDLAAGLQVDSVAEGVETAATAELLEQLDVGSLQGNFIAPPMPVEAIAGWLAIWTHTAPTKDAAEGPHGVSAKTPAHTQTAVASADAMHVADLQLPPRQLQVMQLVSSGFSVKEIARQLGLSPSTVKVHLSHAYSTLGARNRIEAIRRAGALLTAPPGGIDDRHLSFQPRTVPEVIAS